MSVALAITTVSPTRSCDHFSCFWLGKVVCERQKHHSKRRKISAFEDFLEAEKGGAGAKTKAPTPSRPARRVGAIFYAIIARLTRPYVVRGDGRELVAES
jgi:hypothetical protein